MALYTGGTRLINVSQSRYLNLPCNWYFLVVIEIFVHYFFTFLCEFKARGFDRERREGGVRICGIDDRLFGCIISFLLFWTFVEY
jgi:hypothetical protein